MALQGGQVFIQVLPSMKGYFKKVKAEVKADKTKHELKFDYDKKLLSRAKKDLETATTAVEKLRAKEADAAGKVRVAEAQLQSLRERGIDDAGRIAAAEERIAKSKRDSEAAATALADAESKRSASERRVARIETRLETDSAESKFDSFLGTLASKAEREGGGIGSKLVTGLGKTLKAGAITAAATAGGLMATALTKGFNRLEAIDLAKAKFQGLGYEAEQVSSIMDDVVASVKGTAFGTQEAADAAAMALAAGIKPGADLQRTLKLTGDAAAFSNKSIGEIAPMFTKVAESGKLTGAVLTQMGQNSIPIMKGLEEVTGKTAEEIRAMAKDGEIDFATFQDAMEASIGGSALKMGDTFTGSMKNAGAALGRLGEAILDAPFHAAPALFGAATDAIDGLTGKVVALRTILIDGEFNDAVRSAFNVEEDSPLVQRLFKVRETLVDAKDTAVLFFAALTGGTADVDLPWADAVISAGERVRSWFNRIVDIFKQLGELAVRLGPSIAGIAGSLAAASAAIGISVWELLLTTLELLVPILEAILVPTLSVLSGLMQSNQGIVTALVGAYTAWRIATVTASTVLGVKTALTGANTAALGANKIAMATNAATTKVLAAAQGIAAGAQKAWNIALVASKGAFKGAAGGMKALSAAIRANPVMAIVSVITILVGALAAFFTKTETGRKIWAAVWGGIKTAIKAAWDVIGPIFTKIGDLFTWLWKTIAQPIFTAFKVALAVVMTAALLWWETVKFAFEMAGEVIKWLWDTVAKPVWDAMKAGLQALGDFFGQVWSSVIKPAWEAFGAGIKAVWENIVQPAWEALKAALGAVGTFFETIWNSVIKPAWDALGRGVRGVWETVIRPAWDALKTALGAVGDFFRTTWDSVIRPVWEGLGTGIKAVWENVIRPAWDAMKTALGKVGDFFDEVVQGIKTVWNTLQNILAVPINFMIGTVWNNGIRKAWNTVANLLGLSEASELEKIPERATGGAIRGPGTGTSDDVLMWGSNGEHMMTAAEVARAGGHGSVYALRHMLDSRRPFTFVPGQGVIPLPTNLDNTVGDLYGAAPSLFPAPGYKDGGEIVPAWERQLAAAHEFAAAQHGKPYQWAGVGDPSWDCSGFMGSIAAVIQGDEPRRRYWATGHFPIPGAQGFVPGLGPGFSIGVVNGGPGGGHTAGTLGPTTGHSMAVNVESGGSPSMVKYALGAAGADDSQFPQKYHLPIGADGAFVTGGNVGISVSEQENAVKEWVRDRFHDAVNFVVEKGLPKPPPTWLETPGAFMHKGVDSSVDFVFGVVEELGDKLRSVYDTVKEVSDVSSNIARLASMVTFGLFRDQGGWIPPGRSIVRNETGRPEAVFNWEQLELLRQLLHAAGFAGAEKLATDEELAAVVDPDWAGVGAQIGTGLLAEWGNDLLGMFGISSQFEGLALVDEHGRPSRSDEAGERNEASFDDEPTSSPSTTEPVVEEPSTVAPTDRGDVPDSLTRELPAPTVSDVGDAPTGGGSTVDAVKRAFSPYGWDTGAQWAAADWIIGKESTWNPTARNPSSGAFGLFQFLGSTKDQYLPDENPDPYIQGKAGAKYIQDRYGDPLTAKSFWERNGWYDRGGLARGRGFMLKNVIQPERVLDPRETEAFEELVPLLSTAVPALAQMQHNTTAASGVDLRSAEYRDVQIGGDTITNNLYGDVHRRQLDELELRQRQGARRNKSRMR